MKMERKVYGSGGIILKVYFYLGKLIVYIDGLISKIYLGILS